MKKINFLKIGLWIGLIPFSGILILFLMFYIGRTYLALDINVDGIGFLFLMLSVILILVSCLLILISFFTQKKKKNSTISLISVILSVPIILQIVKIHEDLSSRAYIQLINNSEINFGDIQVQEPDKVREFGKLKKNSKKIIYYNPDSGTYKGKQYAGISENYILTQTTYDNYIKLHIPVMHPGEIHKIEITKDLKLRDVHLNKIEFNEK